MRHLFTYRYHLAVGLILLVFVANLFVDIMEVDAAQYAEISREMAETGSYLQVFERGKDYLDKPPLLFWLSSTSFTLFGYHNWSFKLPALLVLFLGIFSTYKLASMWYDRRIARMAALILGTTQAMLLMTNDVRTDGLLTGFTAYALWQLSAFLQHGQWKYLLGSSLAVSLAMMSKGPIGIVFPGIAVGGHLLLTRDWKNILNWRWLVFLVVALILLAPMLWGLYQQFDLHPEKQVYGLDGPSGIEFFFWTQSFGRVTGDIYWEDDSGPLFFVGSMLWDFSPWMLFFVPAWASGWIRIIKNGLRVKEGHEALAISGFTFTFIALSSSQFKLPHYIFPLFPLAAILTARYIWFLVQKQRAWFNRLAIAQGIFIVLFAALAMLNDLQFFPTSSVWPYAVALFLLLITLWFYLRGEGLDRLLLPTTLIMVLFGSTTATRFYPKLLKYQSTNEIGRWASAQEVPDTALFFSGFYGHGLDYYGQRITPSLNVGGVAHRAVGEYLFVAEEKKAVLDSVYAPFYEIERTLPDYPVTRLSLGFLNPETRDQYLRKMYLLRITSEPSLKAPQSP